jgi:amino acid permease
VKRAALVGIIVLFGALSLVGRMDLLTKLSYLWVGAISWLLGILLIFVIGAALNQERERRLKADYDSMARWKRRSFACTTWAFVAAMFFAILWFAPPQRQTAAPWTNLRCDTAATEVTAQTCSPASAR